MTLESMDLSSSRLSTQYLLLRALCLMSGKIGFSACSLLTPL